VFVSAAPSGSTTDITSSPPHAKLWCVSVPFDTKLPRLSRTILVMVLSNPETDSLFSSVRKPLPACNAHSDTPPTDDQTKSLVVTLPPVILEMRSLL